MSHSGDAYLRRLAAFVRTNEKNLAAANSRPQPATIWSWFAETAPVVLAIDTHHLFYVLIRLEAQGFAVGTLDVRVDSPSRPMSYHNVLQDKADTLSLASIRSTLSAVSGLSLGAGWWGRPEPPTLEAELKYLFSSFTKLPALSITAPTNKLIAELADDPPNDNALPLDAFRNLQSLECVDIDPRTLLGWDRLAESLRSLRIKRSGLEDISHLFLGAVLEDQARRAGSTSRRRISRDPAYGTRLPDSVPEEPESASELSSLKWAFLKHLSLSDNSLTFFPSVPYLTSLTHLDLSSNLLVSVPPSFSSLYNLVSLNLSDNMIDSVLAIYQHLGQVLYLNLARNRLESLCGLERLPALERVDLRHNLVDESAEIGRLATLPNITEIWVEGNPFTEIEEGYRIVCFDYFWKEGKTVTLDGSQPGFYEKRNLTAPPPSQMSSSRPVSAAYSPPVVAVGHPHPHAHGTASPPASPSPPAASPNLGPVGAVGVGGKGRRKNKRIVNLDGESDGGDSSRSASHTRTRSDGSGRAVRAAPPQGKKVEPVVKTWSQFALPEEGVAEGSKTDAPRRPRHSRYRSEIATVPTEEETATFRRDRNSATFSAKNSERRARVTASVYERVLDEQGEEEVAEDSVDAYRKQIEALKKDMGDGWLKVFRQNS